MIPTKLPLSSIGQADCAWLTHTLTANDHLTHGQVERVTHESWKKSKYSDIARLQVGYSADARNDNGAAPPATFILKLNKSDHKAKRGALYARREFDFYSRIARAMSHPPAARCYDAVIAPGQDNFHFLLEDLSGTHAHVSNPLPPAVPECEQIMECLARFHAAWWCDPRIGKEIGRPFLDERHSKRAATIADRTGKFLALLGDRISGSRRDTLLALCEVFARLLDNQRAGPLTIAHGDAHFQNFLLAPDRADCRIIDWEAWEVAPGTDDLAFMMAVLWFPERRQRLERDLLRRYHHALVAAGISDYSWDACWKDYRVSVIKHLSTPIYQWVNGVRASVWWSNLERVLASYEDLECAALLREFQRA